MNTLNEDLVKVGIVTSAAQINFSINDLINLFEEDLKEWQDPRIKQYVDDLSSIKFDTIFNHEKEYLALPLAEYERKFHDLILEGKAEIILNGETIPIDKVKYTFTRSKLGQEDAAFYTTDGLEFYNILLAFGE